MFKKLLPFAVALVGFVFLSCNKDEAGNGGNGSNSNNKIENPYFGVNMSGAEFGGIYPGVDGTHYGYPGKADLQYFKNKGFNLVRFPFRWERIQPELGGELNQIELAKMKKFMDEAQEVGMWVLLDMHNFGRYCIYCDGVNSDNNQYAIIGTAQCTVDEFCDAWRRLVPEFMNYPNLWGYDIMNEPNDRLASTPWFNIAQACINTIREIDMETPIIVSGDEFSSAKNWVTESGNLKDLVDPANDLIYQAHVYFDKDASGNYAYSYEEENANVNTGVGRLSPFVEWLKQNNLRGFVGEYGVPDNDGRWLDVLDNALRYLSENGVPGTYWSAGPRWGDYPLAVQPTNNYTEDRPQMSILEKYLVAKQ